MKSHEFCDHCPGCRPVVINVITGIPYAEDSKVMIAVNRSWNQETTYAQRKAFINVTVHNSRKQQDLKLTLLFIDKIKHILESIED